MDKNGWKGFAYLMAANFQAVLLIGLAFKLVSYLEKEYSQSFPWDYLVWPICLLIIAHSYYLIMRQIMKLGEKRKTK